MSEIPPSTNTHRSRSHSQKGVSDRNFQKGYLEPVFYFTSAILLLIILKFIHAAVLSPALGVLGIIIIAVSKESRFRPGVFISAGCILLMAIIFVWQWIDTYFVPVISKELLIGSLDFRTDMFIRGDIFDSLIMVALAWIYHRVLSSINIHRSQKWSVKKSQIIFFKFLFYFQMFILIFWIVVFSLYKAQPILKLSIQDSTMIACAMALLASGIPAIIYISKPRPDEKNRHQHRHHHRHSRDTKVTNSDVV